MKYNFLDQTKINNRFETLIKNIRSESNSFYDSYLDLVETTIRYIIEKENIETNKYTLGEIILDKNFKDFCDKNLEFKADLLIDYVRKINKHKHEKEKEINVEIVLNYMHIFFDLSNAYLKFVGKEILDFDGKYFIQIFGQNKRDNINLNKKVKTLICELEESYKMNKLTTENIKQLKLIINDKTLMLDDLEENNRLLQDKIEKLQEIKICSMESKLNKTIELLLDLKEEIAVNKALSKAVGHSIMGDNFDEFIKEEIVRKDGK